MTASDGPMGPDSGADGQSAAPALDEVQKGMEQLKNLGIPVKSLSKHARDFRSSLSENPEKAKHAYERFQKERAKAWDKWVAFRLKADMLFCEEAIGILSKKGREAGSFEEAFKGVKSERDRAQPSASRERMKDLRKDLEGALESFPDVITLKSWASFEKALDAYEELAKDGEKAAKVKKFFKKLQTASTKKDMNNCLVYSNLLYTNIQGQLSEDTTKDRFKIIKDEVKTLLETMEEYKKFGLEPEGLKLELSKLEGSLDQARAQEAQTALGRITKSISRSEKEYYRRRSTVALLEAADLLEEYSSLIDLKEEMEALGKLMEEKDSLLPKKVAEEGERLLARIKETLFSNFQGEVKNRLETLERSLVGVDLQTEEGRAHLEDLRSSIDSALSNHNITEAMEYLSLAEAAFGQSESEIRLMEIRASYTKFLSYYETLVREDIDVGDLKEKIAQIERMLLSEDSRTDDLADLMAEVGVRIQDRMLLIRRRTFMKEKERMIGILDTIGMPEERKGSLKEKLSELESMIENLEEKEFNKEFETFKADLDQEAANYYRDNYDQWTRKLFGSISEFSGYGMETGTLQGRMDEASRLYSDKSYLEAGEVLREIETDLKALEREKAFKEAEDLINSAEFMFDEAKRAGVELKEQERTLTRAKELLSEGKVKDAMRVAHDLEGSIKSRWMELRKQNLEKDISGLRSYVEESSTLGLDINETLEMLNEADFLYNQEKFDEVSDIVGRAKETMDQKRKTFFSENAMASISTLKEDLAAFSAMGIDTLEVETLLIEAERLFMNEEYEKAYSLTLNIREQITAGRETHFRETIPKEMLEVSGKLGMLEGFGLDTQDIRDYMNEAQRLMEAGDLAGSLATVRKAKEASEELLKSHITLAIPETIIDVRRQMETAINEGMDLMEVQHILKKAEDLFKHEDYDEAMAYIEKAQSEFESRKSGFYKDKFNKNLEQVEDMMSKATGMETEIELSRNNINMARDAFERGDFSASHKLMEKVITFLQKSMEDHETGKRMDIVQTQYEEVRTLLNVAQGENIDVTEERSLLGIANELIGKGELDQAEHVLEGIKVGINDKRMQMKRKLIERSIQTSDILLDNMNEMGIDTSYERSLIEQMKDALRRGDLDSCDEINSRLTQALQRNQGQFQVQKLQRGIADVKRKISEGSSDGLDTSLAQKHLAESLTLFERGDLENSEKKLSDARDAMEKAHNERFKSDYETMLKNVRETLDRVQSLGIPVDDEEEVIANASGYAEQGDYPGAMGWLETATMGANAKLNSFYKTTSEGYLTQMTAYMKDLRGIQIDATELERLYQEALADHEQGEYEKAVKKFTSILEVGEELRTLKDLSMLRKRLDQQTERYEDLKSVGMKPSKKVEEMLKACRDLISQDRVDAGRLAKELDRTDQVLRKKSEPHAQEMAKKHLSDVRAVLKEMEGKGIKPDQETIAKLKEVGELFRKGDFQAADAMALDSKEILEKLQMSEIENVLKREVSSVKQMLLRLKTLGSNVTNAEKLITRAESALEMGKVENAEKMIEAVREAVKDIVTRNLRERALETIEFTDSMVHYLIDNFSGVSQKVEPATEMLDGARNLFREKKFKLAKTKAEEARNFVERLDLQNISQFLYVFRSMQAEEISRSVELRIQELAARGMDTNKLNMLFQKAKEHFGKDEHEKGRQMITFTRVMLAEIDQQSLRDSAVDELNNTHLEILARRKEGMDVAAAYKVYNSAKEAFAMGEFKKAVLLAKKAGQMVKRP